MPPVRRTHLSRKLEKAHQMTANYSGPLTNRQHEKFAQGLAELLTLEDAYRGAGYMPDRGNATRLAARPDVKARVDQLMRETAEFANVRRERVVIELDRIARSNIMDFIDVKAGEDGKIVISLKDLSKLPREATAAIQSIEPNGKTGGYKIKLHDRNAANTTLLRYLGGLPEAPTSPALSIFNVLSADDQRALADALEQAAENMTH